MTIAELNALKPSELVSLALSDIDRVMAGELEVNGLPVKVDMEMYIGKTDKTCYVCLAGALLVGQGIPYSVTVNGLLDLYRGSYKSEGGLQSLFNSASQQNSKTNKVCYGLDEFRQGNVRNGLREMGIAPGDDVCDCLVAPFDMHPAQWREDMNKVVQILEECGL